MKDIPSDPARKISFCKWFMSG